MTDARSPTRALPACAARTRAAFSAPSISARLLPLLLLLRLLTATGAVLTTQAAVAQLLPAPELQPAQSVAAAPYEAALAQYRAGDLAPALTTLERALEADRRDLRVRFLRAVVLTGLGRDDAAIEAFRSMTEEFPELPEPHNNLAVLHAARGELDLARTALQDALRAAPGYALAHENLGDLYLRFAQRAYEQARRHDPASKSAGAKLRLATDAVAQALRLSPAPTPSLSSNPRRP
jgi:Flp pilus assembly protein TadD